MIANKVAMIIAAAAIAAAPRALQQHQKKTPQGKGWPPAARPGAVPPLGWATWCRSP